MTSLFVEHALLPNGWARDVRITMKDRQFAEVIPHTVPQPDDERVAIAVPGLPNLHSHGFQRGMAGLSEQRGPAADDFWTWRQVMYRFLATMTPEHVQAITALAYVEMLESGFTRVAEFHYLHNDIDGRPYANPAELAASVVQAADDAGIGLLLLPVFYAQGGFGPAPPDPGQRRFLTDLDGYARLLEACRALAPCGIAPHSLRAVTPDQLAALLPLAGDAPIHMHIAEQTREVESCLAWSGARPVQWLLDHAPVDARWCLIHATHMTPNETWRLAATRAVAGLCPVTEASLGDGVFPGPDWITAGGRYGVGTDSNVLVDAAGELRQLEWAQRLHRRGRNLMAGAEGSSTGASLFNAALTGGAAALGLDAVGLRADAPADLVSLRADRLPPVMGDEWLDAWVFAAGAGAVDAVWSNGRCVVRDGRHGARAGIATRYRACLRELLA